MNIRNIGRAVGLVILFIGVIVFSYGIYIGIELNWGSSAAFGYMIYIPMGIILILIGFVLILYYQKKKVK